MSAIPMDFERFAAERGASMADMGDAGTHKRGRNQSDKQWTRLLRRVEDASNALLSRRLTIRQEYETAVERGEIRPLSRIERLERAALGHPDLESTQAAKRVLAKITEGAQS